MPSKNCAKLPSVRWKLEPINLGRKIVQILEDKLAEDILLLDLTGISDFTDSFVIANGTSERMLQSLADYVREIIKQETGLNPVIESSGQSGWIVLDYGYVVVHLLSPEMREYYDLEGLWQKAKVVLSVQ